MPALKCPNPSCPYLFDPDKVPPGAVLTCPRCAMRFTLGTAPPTRAEDSGPVVQRQHQQSKPFYATRGMLVLGFGACVLVAAAVAAVLFAKGKTPPGPPPQAGEKQFREFNFAITVPTDWEQDDALKVIVRANALALKRPNSSARFALAFSDFKSRNPQPGELRDGLVSERLDKLFEHHDVTDGSGPWLGEPALRLTFRGRRGDDTFLGEAVAAGRHGRAYWLITWAVEADYAGVSEELAKIRDSARLLEANPNWKPSTAGTVAFKGAGADYTLTDGDGDGWWEKQSEPTREDAKADLLLNAKFRTRSRSDFPPKAWAVTFLLPAADDPLITLRAHVAERYKQLKIEKLVEVTGEPRGDPPAAGMPNVEGVLRLHAESDDPNGSKFLALNAIAVPGAIVGIEAGCAWSDRNVWEKRLIALAATLKK